ncbi:conserved hypothetical protein [Ricinus communis]|uniref:Uncharacterized protein n=1 Tax=Ricinus communis TaxID=3988 RepID=B9TKW0_RICCO|nr:conserved hypothetical protein [Ricinus communis]
MPPVPPRAPRQACRERCGRTGSGSARAGARRLVARPRPDQPAGRPRGSPSRNRRPRTRCGARPAATTAAPAPPWPGRRTAGARRPDRAARRPAHGRD